MQFINLPFRASKYLCDELVSKLVTKNGTFLITLKDDNYDNESGGFRPYQMVVTRENKGINLDILIEFNLNYNNQIKISNRFDFSKNSYLFEFIGEVNEETIGKKELADVYNLFTNNIVSYYKNDYYSTVEVESYTK